MQPPTGEEIGRGSKGWSLGIRICGFLVGKTNSATDDFLAVEGVRLEGFNNRGFQNLERD